MRCVSKRRAIASAVAGVWCLGFAGAQAAPITISVFEEEFTAVNNSNGQLRNPDGELDLEFIIDDLNGDGVIEDGEVLSFSFLFSGFNDSLLNLSDTDFTFETTVGVPNSGGLRELGNTGLMWEGVSFSAFGADNYKRTFMITTLSLGLSVLDPEQIFFPLIAGDVAYNPVFVTADPQSPSEVPLPAAAPLMAMGLGALGLIRRKRRKHAA